ncbi:MAG TPA: sigma-54 dependent transcriptional regulator [Bacteroidota bacterium]|nr:sigma-54 dependent transcriptional regulator [Bacteroidota bacterium]
MTHPRWKILLADDEAEFSVLVAEFLRHEGYDIETVGDGVAAMNLLRQKTFELVMLDIAMPKVDGLEVLSFVVERYPESEVIMLTGSNDVGTAVECMKRGAFHYITKPFKPDELLQLIQRALEHHDLKQSNSAMASELSRLGERMELIGKGKALTAILDLARRVAPTDTNVLIQGASGTGKELLANFIYRHSARAGKPFVAINCASIPDTLIESELFGYEKGAFTDARSQKQGLAELANNGTLFFDEVGDISPVIQPKLLRFIQTGEFRRVGGNLTHHVDVRMISATNKDLQQLVEAGKFREDLLYRLNVITLSLPPLNDRKEDIPALVDYFLKQKNPKGTPKHISPEALELLLQYDWPGNIRELENVMEGSMIMADGDIIGPDDFLLPAVLRRHRTTGHREDPSSIVPLKEVERKHISRVLHHVQWNKRDAASLLGISLKTLYTKIATYHIEPE